MSKDVVSMRQQRRRRKGRCNIIQYIYRISFLVYKERKGNQTLLSLFSNRAVGCAEVGHVDEREVSESAPNRRPVFPSLFFFIRRTRVPFAIAFPSGIIDLISGYNKCASDLHGPLQKCSDIPLK